MISPIFYSGLAFAFIKPLPTSQAVSHLPSPQLSPFALLSLLKPHSLQAQPSVNSCLQYFVYPVPWLSAIQAGCADKGRPLGLSVMGLFSGRRRFSWFADTGWRVRGLEGRAFGGDLYCVCAWLRTFVHLAGSYKGLASPDDRYEGGGERDSGGKKKGTQGLLHQHNWTHTLRRSHIRTWPVEGQWPQQHSWKWMPLRERCFNQRAKSKNSVKPF